MVLSGKRNRFDLWLVGICLSRVLNGLIFMTYAGALAVLRREWEMSAAQAGAIASGFQIGYALSLVIFSTVADRISPRKVYLWSMFAAGISGLAFALLARDFSSALLLHTLLGIALGGTYTTGVMIIADQYEVRSRGMAVGFFIASTSLGYACSLALSGMALPLGGYKLSFVITCIGPLIGWLVALVTLRRTETPAAVRQKGQRFTREVLGNRRAMLLIWGYSFHNWELQGMWAWTPAFMAACLGMAGMAGLKAAGSAAHMAAFFHIMGLLASFSMGSLSDRLGRARVMLALTAVSTACSFLFGWSIGWPLALIIAVGAIYAFAVLGDSPVFSTALTEAVDTAYLGSALGLRSLIGFGAAAIAPLAFGAALDWTNPAVDGEQVYATWGWAFGVLGLGGLAALWAVWRFAGVEGETR